MARRINQVASMYQTHPGFIEHSQRVYGMAENGKIPNDANRWQSPINTGHVRCPRSVMDLMVVNLFVVNHLQGARLDVRGPGCVVRKPVGRDSRPRNPALQNSQYRQLGQPIRQRVRIVAYRGRRNVSAVFNLTAGQPTRTI